MVKKREEKNNLKKPKVSIIIPVYNGEEYISLAIDSALNQTYSNLEIIVVNDGSKDNTDNICKSYGNKIKYINKENGGVSTALNEGIRNMTGDYFSWLSHDDLYYSNKVEEEVDYLIKNKLLGTKTIVYSDYSIINEYGELSTDIEMNSKYLNRNSAYPILFGSINGLTPLVPKEAFDKVGYFNEKLRCVQDNKLWFDMYKKGYKFIHIPQVLASTRVHSKQVTNTSPLVVSEGNDYWLEVLKHFSVKEQEELFGSTFNYWFIMHSFFEGGPYNKVIETCVEKYTKIIEKNDGKTPKVSVIVNLNSTSTNNLKCLKSLINQTYSNIQYLIYSNGELKDEEIEDTINCDYYKIRNKTSILSEGIKKSSGDYITFIEGNCCYEENKISRQVNMMLCSDNIMTYSSYKNEKDVLVDIGFNNWQIDETAKEVENINLSTIMVDKKIRNTLTSEKIDKNFIIEVLKLGYPLGIRDSLVNASTEVKTITKEINNEEDFNNKNNRLLELKKYELEKPKERNYIKLLKRIKSIIKRIIHK